jgi:hypothetical protein
VLLQRSHCLSEISNVCACRVASATGFFLLLYLFFYDFSKIYTIIFFFKRGIVLNW